MILTRTRKGPDGVFGILTDGDLFSCVTLEHNFPTGPVIPVGEYLCVLGSHQLEGMSEPFQTYEVTGVAGHSGLLFHMGNCNADSSGCILLGEKVVGGAPNRVILRSRVTFEAFMAYLKGATDFVLTVCEAFT